MLGINCELYQYYYYFIIVMFELIKLAVKYAI